MSKGKTDRNIRRGEQSCPEGYVECPLVFISAPWDEEKEEYPAWVRDACRMAMKQGCEPVAPYGMYSYVVDGLKENREECLSALVMVMLSACREFWIIEDESRVLSDNQACELVRAAELDKPIRHFSWRAGEHT